MKRNEFKLLIENWRKNFIVESPEDPYGVQQPLGQDDLDFASDHDEMDQDSVGTMDDMSMSGDFSDLDRDDMALARGDDHIDYLDSADDSLGHGGHSLPSFDTHSQQSFGRYPEDDEFDSAEFDHDYSSIGGDDIDDLLPEVDLMDDDDNDGF